MAIVVLYYVVNMTRRLAIVGVFTVIFATALAIFTDGRGVEIFSASSA
jgi:hypothetical protein